MDSKGPYKREVGAKGQGRQRDEERVSDGFEDGGRAHNVRSQGSLEAGSGKETDSLVETPEGASPGDILTSVQ